MERRRQHEKKGQTVRLAFAADGTLILVR